MTSQPENYIAVGDAIRKIREESGLGSLISASEKLGFNKNTIASYERGLTLPDIDFLVVFAEKTGTDFNELLRLRLAASRYETARELQGRFALNKSAVGMGEMSAEGLAGASQPMDKVIAPVHVPESLLEMAGGDTAQISLDILMELLLAARSALAAIKADTAMPAQQSVALLASLQDTIEKTMSSMRGVSPEINKGAVAVRVLRGMTEFVQARFPQHLKTFLEILEPFGDELGPILAEPDSTADSGGDVTKG